MKKIINHLILSIFIFSFFVFVSSCDLKSEDDIISSKVDNLIELLDKNDKDGLKKLFAESKIENIENFTDSLDELIEYYDGVLTSKLNCSKGTDRDKNANYQATWYNLSYKIITSTEIYRIAIYWCTEYTTDSKQLGIWSFYIINEKDYPTPDYAYRGDGLWTPGINIGKMYVED